VGEQSIFGFIGRNGAGKTTTMKIILGLLTADSGSVTVCGEPVTYGETATNRWIGYLPDVPEFYPYMRAKEYLTICGEVAGLSGKELKTRIEELLGLVGLSKEKARIGGYSRGMKQRLGVAQALIGRPKLLICDEPTSALDPVGRHELLEILLAAKEQTSVLFSTHILSDVERISDHVALLEGGEVKATGSIEELKAMRSEPGAALTLKKRDDMAKVLKVFPKAEQRENRIEFRELKAEEEGRLLSFLASEKLTVTRFERKEPDLEDLFMEAIKET
jgi:ABC-2 type transport system ATP-binding protein